MCLWFWPFLVLLTASSTAQLRIELQREQVSIKGKQMPHEVSPLHIRKTMNNYRNVYYYSDVKLGTPGQELRVVFDTGSPSLWVYSGSPKAWNCLACWIHKKYFHILSKTYRKEGRPVTINYISSYVEGFTSKDVLTVGEARVNVTFAEATAGPFWSSLNEKFDGILGLAPCAGSVCKYFRNEPEPVVADLLRATNSDTFSVYLDRTGNGQSEILFGGTNTSLYKEETLMMHRTPADYIWTVRLDGILVGDQMVVDYTWTPPVEAYVDTGTSLIVGPSADVNRILKALGLPSGLDMPCDQISKLQNISFIIGGMKYTLQPEDYASLKDKTAMGRPMCYHGLEGMEVGGGSWVLGDNFLGSFYTVFKMAGKKASKIGFAELKRPASR